MSLLLSQVPSPFNPGNGFPYEQSPGPPAHSVAQQATALLMVATAFVAIPPPVDPSNVETWQPNYPDQPGVAAVRSPGLRPSVFQPPEQFGTAVRFVGAAQNNGLQTTSNLFGPTNFSVATFFYLPTIPGPDASLWMIQDTTGAVPTSYINIEVSSGQLAVSWTAGGFQPLGPVVAGKWYFVALSVGTGGNANAYWGSVGTTLSSLAITGVTTTLVPAALTVDTDFFTEPLDGRLCSLKIWTASISSTEATAESKQLAPARTANIQRWLKLDNASTRGKDSSGFGRDLTDIGAGTWVTEEGPFFAPGPFNPGFTGFPWEQPPDPTRSIVRASHLLDGGGGGDFTFVPTATFDPSTGFPWEQSPGPVLPLPRSVALLDASSDKFVFAPVSSTFDPSTGFPWEQSVDRVPAAQRPINIPTVFWTNLEREPVTDWLPDYPDFPGRQALRAPSLSTEEEFFSNPDFVAKLSWEPEFPDFARTRPRPLDVGQSVLVIQEREPITDWLPDFPDFARAAQRPINEGGVSWTRLEYEPSTDWISKYPDILPGRALPRPVNEGGSFFDNFDFVPRLSWAPTYPDFARAKPQPVSTGWFCFVIQEREPVTDWIPDYPDFPARALPLPASLKTEEVFFTNPDFVPKLSWDPSFPDFARAASRPVNVGQSVVTVQEREPVTDWMPEYPDYIDVAKRPLNTSSLHWTNLEREPIVDWMPEYPDSVRGLPRPVDEGYTARSFLQPPVVVFLNFFPEYPDRFPAPTRPNTGGLFWTNIEREPTTDWLPKYPDFIRSAPRPINEGGEVFVDRDVAPKLSWQPEYPDFPARGPRVPVNEGYSAFVNADLVPRLSWAPDYPDFVLSKPRPVSGAGGLTWTNVEREPIVDWAPIYPDFPERAPKRATALLELGESFVNWDFVPKLAWSPDYPDFARSSKRPLNSGGTAFDVPHPPPPVPFLSWAPSYPDIIWTKAPDYWDPFFNCNVIPIAKATTKANATVATYPPSATIVTPVFPGALVKVFQANYASLLLVQMTMVASADVNSFAGSSMTVVIPPYAAVSSNSLSADMDTKSYEASLVVSIT